MSTDDHPIAPGHEYELVPSQTPVDVDGYKLGEPKKLVCEYCEASMLITPDPTPGLWSVNHAPHCPNVE